MRVVVDFAGSTHVSHETLRELSRKHFAASLLKEVEGVNFDLSAVSRFELCEAAILLAWSSALRKLGKSVSWAFPPYVALDSAGHIFRLHGKDGLSCDDMISALERGAGEDIARTVNARLKAIERNVRGGVSIQDWQRIRRAYDDLAGVEAITSRSKDLVKELTTFVARQFNGMRVIGFANRIGLLHALVRLGCEIKPHDWNSLAWPYTKSENTGTIPLFPLTSETDLDIHRDQLGDKNELSGLFERYADMDLLASGALSDVILYELGANVIEHSGTSVGWVATRVVRPEQMGSFGGGVRNDQHVGFFERVADRGFLEVVVSDAGGGIPNKLRPLLQTLCKENAHFRSKYDPSKDGDVIEYAFDRLSSSRRSPRELLDYFENKSSTKDLMRRSIGSGLFWIWNLVRSYRGFALVRSGEDERGYDFSDCEHEDSRDRSTRVFPGAGTQVWIALPLEKGEEKPARVTRQVRPAEQRSSASVAHELAMVQKHVTGDTTFEFFWLGHLYAKTTFTDLSRDVRDEEAAQIYAELKARCENTRTADAVLVLDVTSVHERWCSRNARYISVALMEMNYQDPVGLHTAVLFNAPKRSREVFAENIDAYCRLLMEREPGLAHIRLATVVFWDDGQVEFFAPDSIVPIVLRELGAAGDPTSLTDITIGVHRVLQDRQGKSYLWRDMDGQCPLPDRDHIRKILQDNPHLVALCEEIDNEIWFRLRLHRDHVKDRAMANMKEELEELAQLDLNSEEIDGNSCAFVRKALSSGKAYWLPSNNLYASEFWQLGVLASHEMWRGRIGWYIAEKVRDVQDEEALCINQIITLTRSTPRFLEEAGAFLSCLGITPDIVVKDDIESLRREMGDLRSVDDGPNVIIFTDVISTGTLMEETRNLLVGKGYRVVCVFAVADIREGQEWESEIEAEAIIHKAVRKTKECLGAPVVIDPLEVCPVGGIPETLYSTEDAMWLLSPSELIEKGAEGDCLVTKHVHVHRYHHYIYYFSGKALLTQFLPGSSTETIATELNKLLAKDLSSSIPSEVVLFYPDLRQSQCKELLDLVCATIGAFWRHIIYRDLVGGRWRYSAFVEHGVRLSGRDVVIVDDGGCTGDTLIALIETAVFRGAKRVCVYFLVDRMALIKSDLFARLRELRSGHDGAIKATVRIRAVGGLQIPAYTPDACPLCSLKNEIVLAGGKYPSVTRTASELAGQLGFYNAYTGQLDGGAERRNDAGKQTDGAGNEGRLPWALPSDEVHTWRIRQALEYFPYEEPRPAENAESSLGLLERMLKEPDGLLSFAFIACSEPDILTNTWMKSKSEPLAEAWQKEMQANGLSDLKITTYAEAIFRVCESGIFGFGSELAECARTTLSNLSVSVHGEAGAERLMLLIALAIDNEPMQDRRRNALTWANILVEYGNSHWQNLYLEHVLSGVIEIALLSSAPEIVHPAGIHKAHTIVSMAQRLARDFVGHTQFATIGNDLLKIVFCQATDGTRGCIVTPKDQEFLVRLRDDLENLLFLARAISTVGEKISSCRITHRLLANTKETHYSDAIVRLRANVVSLLRLCRGGAPFEATVASVVYHN